MRQANLSHLMRGEAIRWRSRPSVRLLLLVASIAVAAAIPGSVGPAFASGSPDHAADTILLLGFGGVLFSTIAGVIDVTSEHASGTIGRTFVLAGDARRVMLAKLAVAGLAGIVFATVVGLVTLGVSMASFAASGHDAMTVAGRAATLAGPMLVVALGPAWGVALGWLVRQQLGAVIGVVLWTVVIETVLATALPSVGRFSPGGAQSAIMDDPELATRVAPAIGLALFLTWLTFAAASALVLDRRRDLV